jgi:hypothetical protein
MKTIITIISLSLLTTCLITCWALVDEPSPTTPCELKQSREVQPGCCENNDNGSCNLVLEGKVEDLCQGCYPCSTCFNTWHKKVKDLMYQAKRLGLPTKAIEATMKKRSPSSSK